MDGLFKGFFLVSHVLHVQPWLPTTQGGSNVLRSGHESFNVTTLISHNGRIREGELWRIRKHGISHWDGETDNYLFITTRKQSLGKGNVFTGVCLSTGGGNCLEGVCLRRGWADPPGTRKASYWNTFLFSFKFNFVSNCHNHFFCPSSQLIHFWVSWHGMMTFFGFKQEIFLCTVHTSNKSAFQ